MDVNPQQIGLTVGPAIAESSEVQIDRLHRELGESLAALSSTPAAKISAAYELLQRHVSEGDVSAKLADALLRVARYFFRTSNPMAGIAPALDAEKVARSAGDLSLLRQALSVRGVLLLDTSNTPEATQCFSHALEIAHQLNDPLAESAIWNNLGALLLQGSLTADAGACFDRVAALSEGKPELADFRSMALANAALAAYHERDYGRGYRLCLMCLQDLGEPRNSSDAYARAVLEATFARILTALGDAEKAREFALSARAFAAKSEMPRATLAAEVALGLTEVASNAADVGLTRIQRMTSMSRAKVRSELVDTLSAAVTAYERAGQPDVALMYLHELLTLNKESKAKQVLMHHHQHVARLNRTQRVEPDAVDNQLRWQQGTLRGKLATADRERIKNLGQLVEQQALAAERLDDTTGEHCYRVGRLASILGREVGLEDDVCFLVDLAARLHDIGKLIVPDAILLKPGKLTPGEREIMETHTVAGWEILGQTNIPQMHIAQEIARHHHERWDGTGYPDRLATTSIPIAARVSALADVFDALTHKRPYKEAWPVADALAEIKRLRGRQFDPELTDIFLDLVPRLQREHGDLDRFLAEEAKHSPFIQARERIARALKGENPEVSVFELRR
jgi:putative two-component system response regulator